MATDRPRVPEDGSWPLMRWDKVADEKYDPYVGYALLNGVQLPPVLSEDELEI